MDDGQYTWDVNSKTIKWRPSRWQSKVVLSSFQWRSHLTHRQFPDLSIKMANITRQLSKCRKCSQDATWI